ncbi:MAG: DUF1028 domain-containing protein, partial [Chitinophagaceae bacterium]|nr:DUF1028 domain-containing protein [Chitinophagaceae bacterium]
MRILALIAFVCLSHQSFTQVYRVKEPLVHTYSIVARDEETGEMAVGVQSHCFSVGTSV